MSTFLPHTSHSVRLLPTKEGENCSNCLPPNYPYSPLLFFRWILSMFICLTGLLFSFSFVYFIYISCTTSTLHKFLSTVHNKTKNGQSSSRPDSCACTSHWPLSCSYNTTMKPSFHFLFFLKEKKKNPKPFQLSGLGQTVANQTSPSFFIWRVLVLRRMHTHECYRSPFSR